jgi:DNA-binding NtrC family response regulator
MSARILVTDDDAVSCQLLAEVLTGEGYQVDQARTGEEALERVAGGYDLLVVDLRLPGVSGLEVTQVVRQQAPALPVVVITAFGSMATAVEAIQEGAADYIAKPMDLEQLKQTVSRALARRVPQSQDSERTPEREEAAPPGTLIGTSPAMVAVYKTVARVAPTNSTVLILGESGTGKELIARALHQHSPRARSPFVTVDCGTLTETLLESELFGHVRGAFTGAVADKKGVFEQAQGGTCFLDEIGDISLNMQAKLLRVLQEHEVRRVGGKEWVKVDVRVVAATNKDLMDLVRQGGFRQDLYYRLHVVSLHLPALRERPEDIPALATHFLRHYSQQSGKPLIAIAEEAMDYLRAYPWPGNIRELENVIERAVALSSQPSVLAEDLPAEVREATASSSSVDPARAEQSPASDLATLEEVKRHHVLRVLGHTHGNISRAAEILAIDRRSLYRMLKRYKYTPLRSGE